MEPIAPAAAAMTTCTTCGSERSGPFCTECGQREASRHTLRRLLVDGVLGRVLNLEQGLLYTAWLLTITPGRVVRDYIAGRTVPYTHPVGFLLIAFAAFAIMARMAGSFGNLGEGNRFFAALLIPFVALASRIVFWRTRLNYAEHLILAMYLFGHTALVLGILQLVLPLLATPAAAAYLIFIGAAAFVYLLWAYSGFFRQVRPVLAVAGAFVSLAVGSVLWLIGVAVLVRVLRR